MTIALKAVYSTLQLHLQHLCNGRVYPDLVKSDTQRPYIVYTVLPGGGSTQRRQRLPSAQYTFVVKKVADTLAESFEIEEIQSLLHDNGTQSPHETPLPYDSEWDITTVTQGNDVHGVELVDGVPLYSTGNEYVFVMERRG